MAVRRFIYVPNYHKLSCRKKITLGSFTLSNNNNNNNIFRASVMSVRSFNQEQ